MRHLCVILSGICGLAVVGIVIAVAGTTVVPLGFLAWAVPFLAGALIFAWKARRLGRGEPR